MKYVDAKEEGVRPVRSKCILCAFQFEEIDVRLGSATLVGALCGPWWKQVGSFTWIVSISKDHLSACFAAHMNSLSEHGPVWCERFLLSHSVARQRHSSHSFLCDNYKVTEIYIACLTTVKHGTGLSMRIGLLKCQTIFSLRWVF